MDYAQPSARPQPSATQRILPWREADSSPATGRLYVPERFAQITVRHIGLVPQVLIGQRIIEAMLGAQFLEIRLDGARAGQDDQHWVTSLLDQHEDNQAGAERHEDRLKQASKKIACYSCNPEGARNRVTEFLAPLACRRTTRS